MTTIKKHLLLSIIGVASLAAACSKATPASGDGGTGGTTSGCVLVASATGFVTGTDCAAMGPWYAYADGYADGASTVGAGPCQAMGGHTMCSTFTTPTPGMPFAPDPNGAMCASGTAAQVVNGTNGMADYSNIYGAAIALDLNNAGTDDGGTGAKGSYNPTTKSPAITGVAFDIDNVPTNAMRVELPTNAMLPGTSNDAAWWGGGANMNASPIKRGHNSFKWADVGGPTYLTNPPAFDKTQITSIKFHVITSTDAPVMFNFCVSNLTLTTN